MTTHDSPAQPLLAATFGENLKQNCLWEKGRKRGLPVQLHRKVGEGGVKTLRVPGIDGRRSINLGKSTFSWLPTLRAERRALTVWVIFQVRAPASGGRRRAQCRPPEPWHRAGRVRNEVKRLSGAWRGNFAESSMSLRAAAMSSRKSMQ